VGVLLVAAIVVPLGVSAAKKRSARLRAEAAQRQLAMQAEESRRLLAAQTEEAQRLRQAQAEETERQRQAQADETHRKLAAQEAERQRRFAEYVESLRQRFGEQIAQLIVSKTLWQGASGEIVREMFGEPAEVSTRVYKTKTAETWKFNRTSGKKYALQVTIENGLCVGWKTND
jgi:hypothetical protein